MTYGTSHFLIGGAGGGGQEIFMGYFKGEGQEKILLCKGGSHYMKNKNIGGVFFNST